MGREPSARAGRPIRVEAHGSVQRAFDSLHRRLADLESRTDLSGSVAASQSVLSGSVASSVVGLSGTVSSAVAAAVTSIAALSGTADSAVKALSGTIDAQLAYDGLDPRRGFRFLDDFTGSTLSLPRTTMGFVSDELGHPGILSLSVAASGTGIDYAYVKDTTSGLGSWFFGGGPQYLEALVRIPTLSNGTDNSCLRVGIQEISAAPPANGVYFECDRSRYGDNAWRFCTAATGSRVQQSTGVSPVGGSWTRLRIEVAPAGNAVTGSVDGAGTTALHTFIPAAVGSVYQPCLFAVKTLGAGTMAHHADYMAFGGTFTTPR